MGSHDGLVPGKKQVTAVIRMDTDEGISGAVEIEFPRATPTPSPSSPSAG